MTEQQYNNATQLLKDIKILRDVRIDNQISEELLKEYTGFLQGAIEKRKKEFAEL